MKPTAISTAAPGAPHDLFADPDWADTLIQLYSFSKAYRLTGHRVGRDRRLGAAGWPRWRSSSIPSRSAPASWARSARCGGCGTWRNGWRASGTRSWPAARAMVEGFAALPGWKLLGCGAYFAYVEHPVRHGLRRAVQAAGDRGLAPDAARHDVPARRQRRRRSARSASPLPMSTPRALPRCSAGWPRSAP